MNALEQELAAAIGRATGEAFVPQTTRAMHGGDISDAFTLGDGVRAYFVKTQRAARREACRSRRASQLSSPTFSKVTGSK